MLDDIKAFQIFIKKLLVWTEKEDKTNKTTEISKSQVLLVA